MSTSSSLEGHEDGGEPAFSTLAPELRDVPEWMRRAKALTLHRGHVAVLDTSDTFGVGVALPRRRRHSNRIEE